MSGKLELHTKRSNNCCKTTVQIFFVNSFKKWLRALRYAAIYLLRIVNSPCLTNDDHFDLSGIFHFFLNLLGDIAGQ